MSKKTVLTCPRDIVISDRDSVLVPQVKIRKGEFKASDYPEWAVKKAIKVGVVSEKAIKVGVVSEKVGVDDWDEDDDNSDPSDAPGDDDDENADEAKPGSDAKSVAKAKAGIENKAKK